MFSDSFRIIIMERCSVWLQPVHLSLQVTEFFCSCAAVFIVVCMKIKVWWDPKKIKIKSPTVLFYFDTSLLYPHVLYYKCEWKCMRYVTSWTHDKPCWGAWGTVSQQSFETVRQFLSKVLSLSGDKTLKVKPKSVTPYLFSKSVLPQVKVVGAILV